MVAVVAELGFEPVVQGIDQGGVAGVSPAERLALLGLCEEEQRHRMASKNSTATKRADALRSIEAIVQAGPNASDEIPRRA
ncbi:hypothetical protein AB0I02_08515 [Streptomyces phaeochromogenes]